MKVPGPFSTRRTFLGGAVLPIGLSSFARTGRAQTGEAPSFDLDAIHTSAIAVLKPSGVFLVAITQAFGRLVAGGEHGVIIYSDDNGVTWMQANVPVDVTITCVRFVTPKLGWAAGASGIVLHTADGGKSWQTQLNGVQMNQLTITSAQAAIAQNSTVPGAALAVRRANYFSLGGPSKPFLTLLALSPQKAIVFGSYRLAATTTDGGKTWVDWSLHIYDRLSHDLYDAIVFQGNYYIVGEAGLVFCSTDGGNSFVPLTPPAPVTLFGVVGAGNNNLIVFGVAGNCFRSADNGTTWAQVNLGTQDDLTAGRVLHSTEIVITSETGDVFVSKNNGATFTQVPDLAPVAIFDFEVAANGELISVGGSGVNRLPASILTS